MRKLFVIGIGVGDPDHLTMQAIKALNQVDVFFIPDKGAEKAALRILRMAICERFIEKTDYRTVDLEIPQRASDGDYLAGVDEWHGRLADIYGGAVRAGARRRRGRRPAGVGRSRDLR